MKNQRLRCIPVLALFLLLPALGFAQANREWTKRYNATGNYSYDNAQAIAVDGSGNVLAAGSIETVETGADFATYKRSRDGVQLWLKKYNGPAQGDDRATAVATDKDGNVYVTGWSDGGATGYDFATIKYSKDGAQVWVARYSSAGNVADEPLDIAVDASGNVYVTGYSENAGTKNDYVTVKYNSGGSRQWIKQYNGPAGEYDNAYAVAVDASGNVYVTGYSYGIGSYSDYATVKYNAAGTQQWVKRYNGTGNSYDGAAAVAVDASGNIYVTGRSYGSGTGGDFATIKYNASGLELWVARYNSPDSSHDDANDLVVDKYGNVYVTGGSNNKNYTSDYATVKYNSSGTEQWAARYNSSAIHFDYNIAGKLAVDASGNVYVTGLSGQDEDLYTADIATLKYSPSGTRLWVERFNGTGNGWDAGNALALDASGNVYVAGESFGQGTGMDFFTLKYGTGGGQLWAKREYGTGNGREGATALAVDGSGNVVVTGSGSILENVEDEPVYDYLTVKYTAGGSRSWERRYNGTGDGNDRASALATDAAGNVYVTGYSAGSGTNADFATLKYGADGSLKWTARYNGPAGAGYDAASAIAVDKDGNVYVTGSSDGGDYNNDYATIKYNADGTLAWVKRYNGPGNTYDRPAAIAVDAAGNVYVTGYSYGGVTTRDDYATIKYDKNGLQLWVKRYNGPGSQYDAATALAVDAAGNVYVTGYSTGSGTYEDYTTIKYNTSGTQLWVARHNGKGNNVDVPVAIALDVPGNVLVTGKSWGTGTAHDYLTIKYDKNGVPLWNALYNGTGSSYDEPASLAVDASGNAYVTGYSYSGTNYDYATVKYGANGGLAWADAFNGTGNGHDEATDIAVGAGGYVYVTGRSAGLGTYDDYLTIKYAPSGGSVTAGEERAGNPEVIAMGNGRFSSAHYPNPVAGTARIAYELPSGGRLTIKLYDMLGREVTTIADREASPGKYTTDVDASTLQEGIYYYRISLKAESRVWEQTHKMNVAR